MAHGIRHHRVRVEAKLLRCHHHGFGELPRQVQSLTQALVLEVLANKAHEQASIEMAQLNPHIGSNLPMCARARATRRFRLLFAAPAR